MPSYLSHKIFAEKVKEALKESVCEPVVTAAGNAYFLGAQGADVFYYYLNSHLISGIKVIKFGQKLHKQKTAEVLSSAAGYVRSHYSDALAAYMFGFMTHYALDEALHPLVADFCRGSLNLHNEFERDLAVEEGRRENIKDPQNFDIAADIGRCIDAAPEIDGLFERIAGEVFGMTFAHGLYFESVKATKRFWKKYYKNGFFTRMKQKFFGIIIKTDFESLRLSKNKDMERELLDKALVLRDEAILRAATYCKKICLCILGELSDDKILEQ